MIGFALIYQLFSLQILKHDFYKNLADNQHQADRILFPKRGEIFIKDRFYGLDDSSQFFPLAVNKEWPMVYAIPKEIESAEETAKILAPLLEIDQEILKEKMDKKDDPYEPLKHKLSSGIVEKIKELDIEGIKFITENLRYFPSDSLASQVIGFVGYSNDERVGQYGLEGYYNKKLRGKQGFLNGEKDNQGRLIAVAESYSQPAEDGTNLILTIDTNLQFFVEKELNEVAERLGAQGGTVIVTETQTGAIKAMANWPVFNLNKYSEVEDIKVFLNPAIHDLFEPGSIFKPITMAAALDKKLLGPDTTYEDKGFVKIGATTIHNSHDQPEGVQTMTQVLEKSLNSGAVFVQQLIGKKVFRDYLEKFGFSKETGIDLENETRGNISNLNSKGDVEYATASFGQGIAITPIELAMAMGAIANKGELMKPYLVEKFIYSNGNEETTKPKIVGRPISKGTAEKLTKMMVSVVENGYGKKAKVSGYFIAGKTGTAQVPNTDKRGYSDETIHSFGGFFPAFNPRFLILVKLDNPHGIRFAADSIAPVFREIAKYIINYYEIAPSR